MFLVVNEVLVWQNPLVSTKRVTFLALRSALVKGEARIRILERLLGMVEGSVIAVKDVDMNEIEAHIREWIAKISKIRPELGGFSICPFASTAKIKVIQCKAKDIEPIDGFDVIFYAVEEHFDLQSIQYWVNFYNNLYDEYIFLEDYADYNTFINGVQTNNGKYNLILAQKRDKLRKHRRILRDLGYYAHWNDEMMREVLGEDYNIVKNSG